MKLLRLSGAIRGQETEAQRLRRIYRYHSTPIEQRENWPIAILWLTTFAIVVYVCAGLVK